MQSQSLTGGADLLVGLWKTGQPVPGWRSKQSMCGKGKVDSVLAKARLGAFALEKFQGNGKRR